jgi:membrane-associated phospholipid phosphatase
MLFKPKKILAALALLSVELIIIVVLFVLALICFVYITDNIFALKNTSFDQQAFASIKPYITTATTSIMVVISFFASQNFLLPANILLAAWFLFIDKHRWYSIRVPVVSLGSFAVMSSLKLVFQRARPLDPVFEAARGFSYPSGHAMSAMTFYGLIIYIVWDKVNNKTLKWTLTVLLLIIVLLIGFSRVYLRVHYASDVLAGFSLGIVWLVISLRTISKIEKYTKIKVSPIINEQPNA